MADLGSNMQALKRLKSTFLGAVLSSLTLLSAACVPAPSSQPETTKTTVSPLSPAVANCEAQLRSKMLTKSLPLDQVGVNDPDIAQAAAAIPTMNEAVFKVSKIHDETSEVAISFSVLGPQTRSTLSYELSRASKDSNAILKLQIRSELLNIDKSVTDLTESFQIGADCHATLSSKQLEKITTTSPGRFVHSSVDSYSDGKTDSKQNEFSVPAGEKLGDLDANSNDFLKAPRNGFLYLGGKTLPYVVNETTVRNTKEFGLDLKLRMSELKVGNGLITLKAGQDTKAGVQMSEIAGQTEWTVPESIWLRENLGASRDLNSVVRNELPAGYLKQHSAIILQAGHAPRYEHFDAYWTKTGSSKDANSDLISFSLVENPAAMTKGPSTIKDLESNDTIQTHLPAVQQIVSGILAQSPTDHSAQVQQILNYLATHYSYDTDMLKNNIIRPLTTSEALARGKGVCQHYAVIFTTLARAMGIPSRIIMGYHLEDDGGVVGHAWNEVQIEPGVWRVIEPQNPLSLIVLGLREYLPVLHAINLEDKNAGDTDFVAQLVNLDWVIKPAFSH